MARHGKKYRAASEKVEERPYQLDEAFGLLKQISFAKFNETVELSMLLGVDPKHADQMVRGTTVLPHGTGQTKRVLVIATGEKQKEAQDAGADLVGAILDGRYKILDEASMWRNGIISRSNVADFLVRQIEDQNYIRKALVLVG